MKKSRILYGITLLSLVLCGCENGNGNQNPPHQDEPCDHVDLDKDHKCDKCGEALSEHIDEDKDHKCDYCGSTISTCKDDNKDHYCDICEAKLSDHTDSDKDGICDFCNFAIWPAKDVKELAEILNEEGVDVIPSFEKASKIEIDISSMLDDEYFGIYCYTEDANSENEYKEIVENAGWTVSAEKNEGFTEAFSPNEDFVINFIYDASYKDLEIYVLKAPLLKWPTKKIADYVKEIDPNATDVIPSYEAKLYRLAYVSELSALAINGYGNEKDITEEYKAKVSKAGWLVKTSEESGYLAVSPNKQLEMNFYYEEDTDNFNVDVFKYNAPLDGWDEFEIASFVEKNVGATGEVLKFNYQFTEIKLDNGFYPPAIMITVESAAKADELVAKYNQDLVDAGYQKSFPVYGEDTYCYPGTTLCYRASHVVSSEPIVTIELFNLDKISK